MKLKQETLIIGLGGCGSKIAKGFSDLGYTTIFANGSEQDLKVLGDAKGIYRLEGFDGFGGDREKALECLSKNMSFMNVLNNIEQKIVFIIFSCGGSTGSGLSTLVLNMLKEREDLTVCAVPVLPSVNESIEEHINASEVIEELLSFDDLDATLFLDNSKVKNNNLQWVNKSFVCLLNAFLTDDSYGEPNNFDSAERMKMLKTSGSMVISLTKDGGFEKVLDDNIFAPIQGDRVVENIGIIHSAENDINKDELIAEVGKPMSISEGFGGKNTLVALSGLSYPITQINHLVDLADEAMKERQRNAEQANKVTLKTLNVEKTTIKTPVVKKEKESVTSKKLNKFDALMNLKKEMMSE